MKLVESPGNEFVLLKIPLSSWAKKTFIVLVLLEILFVFLDYHINYGKLIPIGSLRRMFNIAREDGIASWVASTQTLFSGLFLCLIYFIKTRKVIDPPAKWIQWGWLVMTMFFLYMAFDDGAQIHERVASTFRQLSDKKGEGGIFSIFPSYAWQIIFIPTFGLMGLVLLLLIWVEVESKPQRAMLIAALTILVLAVGLDFIEGLDKNHSWNLYSILNRNFPVNEWSEARFDKSGYKAIRHFSKSLEESLEMLANTMFLYIFMNHIPKATKDLRITFVNSSEQIAEK